LQDNILLAESKSSSNGIAATQLNEYNDRPETLRVENPGFVSIEMQGVYLINNRNYPFSLVEGEGVSIIKIEPKQSVDDIEKQSDERVKALEEKKKQAGAEKKELEEKEKANREQSAILKRER
jgi:hypothetical protein